MLSNAGTNRRQSVTNTAPPLFNLTLPEVYSDSREHGYRGPTRHVRLPRATTNGGGSIAKSEDGVRCVVAGRESLRILRMSEVGPSGSSTPTEHKSVTGRGGHRIEASRNLWEGSGLKVDSSSTDVAWCHGSFNTKILTSARNGELIMWDLNKNGPSKYERRTRDHARSIHVLQYSPILQCYCMTGSADGDLRIWDIRDMTKSIMRIHHPSAVRAVAFSPVSSQSRHVVAALDNGSIYRWDLNMGQRGQLDRIPVAHSGPVLSLDWVPPSTPSPSLLTATRQPSSSTWYGGAIDEILPSTPVAGGTSANDNESSGPGWIISGGMDRTVKVWDLTQPGTRSHTAHRPTYTLHTSFPVRRVLWRPGYECELAVVSNADFGTGTDFGHTSLSGGPSSASIGLSSGLSTALSSPRLTSAHLSGTESPRTPEERSSSVSRRETSDPVEIWDVRRGYIAKWVVNGSAVEGGVTGQSHIDFGDSHALWALHSSGTFSQLDLRQCRKPLDAIPRSAISWNTTGSIAFVTDRPKRWEVPYDDIDPDMAKDKPPVKGLGDRPFRPATQNVGAFAPDGAAEDLEMIEKLARGYIYEGKEKRLLCAYNAEIAVNAGAFDAAQTWNLLESLLIDLNLPPSPPLSPLPLSNPPLPHCSSAPAAIPTVSTVNSPPAPQRSMTVDASMSTKQTDNSPGSHSKYSDEKYTRSNSGHRSPRKITPTSSTASSPRKASTGLPSVPAALFARRESATGASQPPMRPRLPSSFRRPSFSTQSILSGHSESPSDNLRASLRHVGEGALDDSDSSESGSEEEATEGADDPKGDSDHEGDSTAPAASSRAPSATYLHRTTTAHPSPLSRRRSSTRSKTRSRSSTVASLAVSPAPRTPFSGSRRVARQESRSSIRTVTVESTPSGTLSRADGGLRRDETVRDLSGGRAGSMRGSQTLSRPKSEAFSHDFALDQDQGANGFGVRMSLGEAGVQTPLSTTRTCSDQTKAVIREAEEKLRQLAWETVRERFEQYADEGDVIMCAMLSLVVPEELKISRLRVARFVEAYIDILNRLRLHTCAAYMRKFVPLDDIKAMTSLQTTIYTTCGKCRKPFVLPAGPMVRSGRPSGSYAYCTNCKGNVVKCSICHLPVRSLLYQCSVCLHGGHQECYRAYYYSPKPPEEITPPPVPPSLRVGRTPEREFGRGRALSRTGSTVAGDTESEDGGSAHGDGDGTTGSYSSAKGVLMSSTKTWGHPCAAGCGHHCWIANDKSDAVL
ncbi:hypothetical protein FKP32DRAFT_1571226 [Trametes sanguinea]|nr:hypothetical protein FKP32DRAFT_1571226 [Trametes sanguinea]